MDTLAIGVLGPLRVTRGGRPVELTGRRQRSLLAAFAMSTGRPLSVERLATVLWDADPPHDFRRRVHSHLVRLRATLGPEAIITDQAGYRLSIEPDRVDALRFVRLLGAAAQSPDPAAERAVLDEALALWRGNPFEAVQSDWLARCEGPPLVERYLGAVERRADLAVGDGRHAELVAPLRALAAQHPLRQSLWVRLMLVLHRCGRHAEAMAQYEQIRARLAAELGVNPGPELQQAHRELLRAGLPRPAAKAPATVPRQLPGDIHGFAGRAAALAALDRQLDGGGGTAVVITAIGGTAGVGKTTLAVHWAHRVAHRFPDGQLYANLRGFHPSGQAMAPAEAVRRFLTALGVPPHRIPSDVDAQAALYRSLLAGRRVLVVLDNARDAGQVRPLLPGSATCLAVVTSRDQLAGLIATEAARPLRIDLLSRDEAYELLAGRLGADRVAAEPDAAEEIITRCARLPLAMAIATARATLDPGAPLAAIASQLRDEASTLDALAGGNPASDARAVFSWSYRALSEAAARLFRLLGLHHGPEMSTSAAASLAGLSVPEIGPPLAELTRAGLLTEPAPGRYASHDLLRAYATELVMSHTAQAERHAAYRRLLDHWLHTAHAVARLTYPHRDTITLAPAVPGVTVEPIGEPDRALAWFAAEHTVLVTMVDRALAAGFDRHAWELAWTLANFLYRHARWDELVATQRAALEAARRLEDPGKQAHALRVIAAAMIKQGAYEPAQANLDRALALYAALGDETGQAHVHSALGHLHHRRRRHPAALRHTEQALTHYRAVGHLRGQANALNELGWYHAAAGDPDPAVDLCQQALRIQREIDDEYGEADTCDSLGYIHQLRGDSDQSMRYYRWAADRYGRLGNPEKRAATLVRLGDTHAAAGQPAAARHAWREALNILDELGHPDADQVRGKLAPA